MTVLLLGLVNWIATTIVVDSELFRPLREWLMGRRDEADIAWVETDMTRRPWAYLAWNKAVYLVGCHLCAGTWVGMAEVLVAGSPWSGLAGGVLGGLLYKAVGHLTLDLVALGKAVRERLSRETS